MTDTERNADEISEIISTQPKPFCFVLMPFDSKFDDVYKIGIKESCETAGAYCERVDEQDFHETSIFQRIINQINKANFIIADMSEKNPNVFYEVGYAHALGKRTILLTNSSGDIPFDLRHFPHLVYDRIQLTDLREKLTRKIKWIIESPNSDYRNIEQELVLYLGNKKLSEHPRHPLAKFDEDNEFVAMITIHNNSSKFINGSDYTFNILSDKVFPFDIEHKRLDEEDIHVFDNNDFIPTLLPTGLTQSTVRYPPDIFPNAYVSIRLNLFLQADRIAPSENLKEVEVIFRINTKNESIDFSLFMLIE